MGYSIITFYKYEDIKYPVDLRDNLRLLCEELNLFGRLLIGKEGINGGLSGKNEDINKFKLSISKVFNNLTFREHKSEKNAYHKLIVRNRKEIVRFGKEVNMDNVGYHVTPLKLKSMIDDNDDLILLDARSNYEHKIGKFKGAKTLPIDKFRDFPDELAGLDLDKNKKIITYCTGGVKCEKASAYLKENGFKDVGQLQGGIINYLEQFNDDNFEGNLFVFDDRLVAYDKTPISNCFYCESISDSYINCHNMDCDKLFICCKNCQIKMDKTCSEVCKNSTRQRQEIKEKTFLGVVTNYFANLKVVEVKTLDKITRNSKVLICGKTTKEFEQKINELRNDECSPIEKCNKKEVITFPVSERVRVNDKVFVYS